MVIELEVMEVDTTTVVAIEPKRRVVKARTKKPVVPKRVAEVAILKDLPAEVYANIISYMDDLKPIYCCILFATMTHSNPYKDEEDDQIKYDTNSFMTRAICEGYLIKAITNCQTYKTPFKIDKVGPRSEYQPLNGDIVTVANSAVELVLTAMNGIIDSLLTKTIRKWKAKPTCEHCVGTVGVGVPAGWLEHYNPGNGYCKECYEFKYAKFSGTPLGSCFGNTGDVRSALSIPKGFPLNEKCDYYGTSMGGKRYMINDVKMKINEFKKKEQAEREAEQRELMALWEKEHAETKAKQKATKKATSIKKRKNGDDSTRSRKKTKTNNGQAINVADQVIILDE